VIDFVEYYDLAFFTSDQAGDLGVKNDPALGQHRIKLLAILGIPNAQLPLFGRTLQALKTFCEGSLR